MSNGSNLAEAIKCLISKTLSFFGDGRKAANVAEPYFERRVQFQRRERIAKG